MTNSRLAAFMIFVGAAHAVSAQSATQPTPPVAAPAPALKLPASSPPPPRPAPLVPSAQRTASAPLSLKAAPDARLPRPSSVHPDSARSATQRAQVAALAAAAPPARLTSPPRRTTAPGAALAITKSVNSAESRPIGVTMRCKDGTYLTGTVAPDRCSANGGVAATYPESPSLVTPRPQPQKRP